MCIVGYVYSYIYVAECTRCTCASAFYRPVQLYCYIYTHFDSFAHKHSCTKHSHANTHTNTYIGLIDTRDWDVLIEMVIGI